MARTISLSSSAGSIDFNAISGIRARAQMRGTGLPPVNLQWFEGAGDGARARGARVLTRTLDMPIKITGDSRESVWARFSLLAQVVAPTAGDVTIGFEVDGIEWYLLARRSGGGDFTWGEDTDGKTTLLTSLTFEAGNPYFMRVDQDAKLILPGGLGKGLLRGVGTFSGLEVSTTTGLGSVEFSNTGDVPAFPLWKVWGPFTNFTLTSPDGKVLNYTAAKTNTHYVLVDTEFGTVVDDTGANMYANLAAAPRFWTIAPGASVATVAMGSPTAGQSKIEVSWRPRKWVLF
jgi:hypothetical protein